MATRILQLWEGFTDEMDSWVSLFREAGDSWIDAGYALAAATRTLAALGIGAAVALLFC